MNGPTSKQISNWKTLYFEIFKIVINGVVYVYRILSIGETQDLQKYSNDPKKVEDFVLDNCILYPVDFNSSAEQIGVCSALAEHVLRSTKIFEPEGLNAILEKSRVAAKNSISNDFFVWSSHIMQHFPGYTFESLEKLSPFKFFKLVHICENIIGKKLIGPVKTQQKTGSNEKIENSHKNTHRSNEYVHDKKVKQLSTNDLNSISLEESETALNEHWKKIKNSRK